MPSFAKPFLYGCLLTVLLAGCQPPAANPPEQQQAAESQEATESRPAEPSPETPAATENMQESVAKPEAGSTPAIAQAATSQGLQYINPLTPEEIEAGWILLFDNETLFGWKKETDINWAVNDQAITGSEGPNGLLLTEVGFADFELELEFKAEPGANAGVFLRSTDPPGHPSTHAYEINICDGHPEGAETGSIVFHKNTDPGFPTTDNQWHTMQVVADKSEIRVTVDGKLIQEFKDERENWLKSGLIGLQKNSGAVAYRKIKLKPLNLTELFNGSDLSGWREVPDSKSVVDVVDGSIHVVNGPGFLETEQTFQNPVVQFQAKTHAPELNSGLFFRAEQGTAAAPSNGYEVQIHNGFKNDDRNQPNNAGTGAIFRRVDARRVVANDLEWATITLVADGPQIATWVQGYPVVNWRDERQPDPNPRKGLRLEAGHLSLQGHDPTTDMSFRKIQAVETAPQ